MKTILKESLPNSTQGQKRSRGVLIQGLLKAPRGKEERKREMWYLVKRNSFSGLVRKHCKGGNGNRSRAVLAPHTFSLNRLDIPMVGVKLELKLT